MTTPTIGRTFVAALATVCLAGALAACGDDGGTASDDSGGDGDQPCADLSPDCAPLFEPTFDGVYQNVIVRSCAVAGSACHASEGAQGGLAFPDDEPDTAFSVLLDGGYVVPEDGSCSEISRRITSDSAGFAMPPGAPLAGSAQCAIVKWIDAGAER